MTREQIADKIDEWCGAANPKSWSGILREIAFACANDPSLLKCLCGYLKREAHLERQRMEEEG